MKKLLLLTMGIVLSSLLFSCSSDPIEMKLINPTNGFTINGNQIMNVQSNRVTNTPAVGIYIKYVPTNQRILINQYIYMVTKVTDDSIYYFKDGKIFIIQFNTGYIWSGGNTQTKFDMYQENFKQTYYDVYVYNN